MSVWLCIPSARPVEEIRLIMEKWREMGYKIALWRDDVEFPSGIADYVRAGEYPGYAKVVNVLALDVLNFQDPDCNWIVAAGDDTLPDPNKRAEEIAEECCTYFWPESTFGVMQPTGDSWEDNHPGEKRLIRRVAGSPWLGREWCLRANQGKGPLWPEFFHMFADEALQQTAIALDVFWQREDLTHLHNHWGRPREGERMGRADRMPDFLVKANSPEEWRKSKAEFERLKAGGFKECFPL